MTSSFSYDETLHAWDVKLPDGMSHIAKSLVVDTPCVARPGSFEFHETLVETSSEMRGVIRTKTVLGRAKPLPQGYVNDPFMNDWKLRWDAEQELWTMWREDVAVAVVSSSWVDLDCHVVSSEGGILNCRAEALVDGRTFREGTSLGAYGIYLRTLVVHDQTVEMNVFAVAHNRFTSMGD